MFYAYYNNASTSKKIYAYYSKDDVIGRTEYYYESGYLYTYADGKTTSTNTNSSVYSNKQNYTTSQAQELLDSML